MSMQDMQQSGCAAKALAAIIIIGTLAISPSTTARADDGQKSDSNEARTLIHMLDYMASDYPGAVKDGEVINEMEYREMQSFTQNIDSLYSSLDLPASDRDRQARHYIRQLHQFVSQKASSDQVATAARNTKQLVVKQTGIAVAPRHWPNLENGKAIFEQQCASCHGAGGAGDGPAAAALNPKPTNFLDSGRMEGISPFQAYNTIQLGVDGTSMNAFTQLSSQEAWDAAFYIKSLLYKKKKTVQPQSKVDVGEFLKQSNLSLEDVAKLNDKQLEARLAENSQVQNPEALVTDLRLYQPVRKASKFISKSLTMLDESLDQYQNGEYSKAQKTAIAAYLEGFEPIESQLSAYDNDLMTRIEQQMMNVRASISDRVPETELAGDIATVSTSLKKANTLLSEQKTTPWISYLLSTSILLREGLEAFLIIITILGILSSVGAYKERRWVHAGWMSAVAIGAASWFFTDWLLAFSADWRELMEGGLALLAVVVLIYVGFWMHRHSEVKQWKKFIDEQIKDKLNAGNLIGLASIAFIAVFREAFESVIFLSAISIEAGSGGDTAIALGSVSALVLLSIIGFAMLKLSMKVPLRALFRYGSYAIGAFSLIMVGQGIHAVQESGLLSVSPTPIHINAGIIGIYPTFETLSAQLITFGLLAGLWIYSNRK